MSHALGEARSTTAAPLASSELDRSRLLAQLSVIIPIGLGDNAWRSLLPDLALLPSKAELILVAAEPQPADLHELVADSTLRCAVRWYASTPGRAVQMNAGAHFAENEMLWFVHADSRLTGEAVTALATSLDQRPSAIHYFDLQFRSDGPRLTSWNSRAVYLRSHYLGLPFGDQALCMSRATFQSLGGFDERAAYGEDHLLIWSAKRNKVPVKCVGAPIATSARKYARHGWLRTTLLHNWRTITQAAPQWIRLVASRL